jgi:hypothetical protein
LIKEDEETAMQYHNSAARSTPPVVITGNVVRVESFPAPPPTSVYAHKVEDSQNGYEMDSDDASIKRRKRNRAIGIVSILLVLFLLLFFLIPRTPRMTYQSTTVYFTTIPLQVEQTYSIQNTNFYSLTLNNFDNLKISSAIYKGTNGDLFQFEASGIGPSSFIISSRQSKTLTLLYNSTSTPLDTLVVSSQCSTDGGLPLLTSGSLDSRTLFGYPRNLPFSKFICLLIFIVLYLLLT